MIPSRLLDNGSVTQARTGLIGGKQLGICDYEQTTAKKQTTLEKLLTELEAVPPWDALTALIEPG